MEAEVVFSCGIDWQDFRTAYERLQDKDKNRLERVARRMWLTNKLRHEISLFHNPFGWANDTFELESIELPSIEIYLLCSCIDTLAGSPSHVDFRDWVKKQPDVHCSRIEEVCDLYTKYQQQHGVTKPIHLLFTNLPRAAKDWLLENVVIRPADEPLEVGKQAPEKLLDLLYRYFFDVRRHPFTHSSVSLFTTIADDIREPTPNGWWVRPASGTCVVLKPGSSKREWHVSYREGLDESIILRLIVHIVALGILGIEVTNEVIQTNLRNYSRLGALYAVVREVHQNAALVHHWSDLIGRPVSQWAEFGLVAFYQGIPALSAQRSNIMLRRFDENPLESGLEQITKQYVQLIEQINATIFEFNESFPPLGDEEPPEVRWQAIKQCLEDLMQRNDCERVQLWPARKEMDGFWRVIENPCHSPRAFRQQEPSQSSCVSL
jgi:hypothetical protein